MKLDFKISELNLNQEPATCSPRATVREIAEILKYAKIGSIVVMDIGKIIGIFTERDFLMKIAGNEAEFLDRPIEEFMTKNPITITPEYSVMDTIKLMDSKGFRHMVIQDDSGVLIGVISLKGLMSYMVQVIGDLEKSLKEVISCMA